MESCEVSREGVVRDATTGTPMTMHCFATSEESELALSVPIHPGLLQGLVSF